MCQFTEQFFQAISVSVGVFIHITPKGSFESIFSRFARQIIEREGLRFHPRDFKSSSVLAPLSP